MHTPEQQSEARVHIASVGRQSVQRFSMHTSGGQHEFESSLGTHAPSRGTHMGRGWHRPLIQAFGAQQSASVVHMSLSGRHGGEHRPSRQVCGAQHSASLTHVAPAAGQGCQMR